MKNNIKEMLYAAGRGELVAVQGILSSGVPVNATNQVGGTALMAACASYRVEVVDYLLRAGADPNIRTKEGQTALHTAVGSSPSMPDRQRDCVRLLLNHGADINAQDRCGITPLMNAAWFGCTPSVTELLNAGATAELKDLQGRTAKDMAVLKKRSDILGLLGAAPH